MTDEQYGRSPGAEALRESRYIQARTQAELNYWRPGGVRIVEMPIDWLGLRMTLYRLLIGFGAGLATAWLVVQ